LKITGQVVAKNAKIKIKITPGTPLIAKREWISTHPSPEVAAGAVVRAMIE